MCVGITRFRNQASFVWFLPPGMIAAMTRHLKSLRHMQRDHGWIHTLLEEAENERMHLLTALVLRKPGPIFKFAVVGAQGELATALVSL